MEIDDEEMGLTEHQKRAYKKCFDIIDVNNDGSLCKDELLKVWNILGFNPTEGDMDKMMIDADKDSDGKISLQEFIKISTKNRNFIKLNEEIESIKVSFSVFDKDCDGCITKAEFKAALQLNNEWITEKDIEDFFHDIDVNDDGKIEINEFVSKFCEPIFN